MNAEDILTLDVHSEEFQLHFYAVLTKFVDEYDDMAQMNIIYKAKELLDTINDN
jgi:hypothetical protein